MTLLISVFAAVVCTAVWYASRRARKLKAGLLCWMFWGASLMWLCDAAFAYAEQGAGYFALAAEEAPGDLLLGLSVVALALTVWIVVLLVTDPEGVVREQLFRKKAGS